MDGLVEYKAIKTMEKNIEMTYKKLGNSTLNISRISFGCMSLKSDQENFDAVIGKAINNGINFFDTADLYDYGANEECLGKTLKQNRKQLIIATKVGNKWRPDRNSFDWNPTKKYILTAAEESLKRLQTDYIDLYQLHGGTMEDDIDDTIDAFETLIRQGKIRYYGISSIRPNVIREYVKRSNIISVMMQYSLLDRRPEETCLKLLMDNNIGVLARGSLASGLLVGKEAKPYLGYDEKTIKDAASAIAMITREDSNLAATAINFVLENPAITAAVAGIRNSNQLIDALQFINSASLSFSDIEMLKMAIPSEQYKIHRGLFLIKRR